MNYLCTTTAFGTTDIKTITTGFTPVGYRITIGQRFVGTKLCNPIEVGE